MYKEILNYQEKEREMIKIEKELGASSERQRLLRAKKFLNDFDKIESMNTRAQNLTIEFNKINGKIADLAKQLSEYDNMSGSSNGADEQNYFIKKVSQLDEKITSAEGELAQVTTDINEHVKYFEDYKKKVKMAKDEFGEYKNKYDELKQSRQPEITDIQNLLTEIEGKIESDLFARYKNIRAKKIFPALVPLSGENCGHCRMELAMNRISEIKDKKIIECEDCGRLIYIEE